MEIALVGIIGVVVGAMLTAVLRVWASRSERLGEKLAEAIEGLYARLCAIRKAVDPLLYFGPKDARPTFSDAHRALIDYYEPKRLYFDESIKSEMASLFVCLLQAAKNDSMGRDGEDHESRQKARDENYGPIRTEIDNIYRRLEQRFCRLLGVDGPLWKVSEWP